MARAPRIEFPGALYHVLNRGNNKNPIFLDEQDYYVFLKYLSETKKEKDFILHCYCLMPNHFHLLIQTTQFPLSEIMHKLLTSYAVYFNSRYARTGHVFQGRYKAILCDKENYFLRLIQYISLNPVEAGLVENINDYKWVSHQAYIGKVKNELLDIENFFIGLGGSFAEGYKLYNDLIIGGFDENFREEFKKAYKKQILGTDDFIKMAEKKRDDSGKKGEKQYSFKKTIKNKEKGLADILDEIAGQFKIPEELILSDSRLKIINDSRKVFCHRAFEKYGYTLKEIADFINRDTTVVSKNIKRVKRGPGLQNRQN